MTHRTAQSTFGVDHKGHALSKKVANTGGLQHHHGVSPMMKDASWRTRANSKPLKITRH